MKRKLWVFLFALLLVGCAGSETPAPIVAATQRPPQLPTEAELDYPVARGQLMSVFGLLEGAQLPVYAEPNAENMIFEVAAQGQIRTTARVAMDGGETWLQVETPAGLGWAQAHYLTEAVTAEAFCERDDVQVLVADLMTAVVLRDGVLLSDRVSPLHGLTIYHEWWNPAVSFSQNEAVNLFSSEIIYDWGVQDGSGMPLVGSFSEILLPALDDTFAGNPTLHCNTLEESTGPSAGYQILPDEYESLNYYVLYRAAPAEQELDWRAWVIGVEFVQDKPYLLFIVQYHWEI